MEKEEKYSKLLIEASLFFYGTTKGTFILPAHGYNLWQNIQSVLDKKFVRHGVQNVLLPTLVPLELLEKEKNHIAGFSPECFLLEKVGAKKLDSPLVLRPTSEVVFYDWYRQILHSYQQLPFLFNQWCSVSRAEKNTTPFFRNTEFLWQEGHTLHTSEQEAQELALNILDDYRDYAENILCLGIIVGRKSEGEKFAGALESYTVECLLSNGQCLQLATSHYFGDSFCRLMGVKFQNKNNQFQHPFSTSWGTSTRAIGALVKTHADNWGLILPFDIAPVQIAFILIQPKEEIINYYQEIIKRLTSVYRCQIYDKNKQINLNILQADKEGCPLKIILGQEEVKKNQVTLIRRDNVEKKIEISNDNLLQVIDRERVSFQKNIAQKSTDYRDKHTYLVDDFSELKKQIIAGDKGLFLIPFCNNLACEKQIKEKIPAYSIRCIPLSKNNDPVEKKCLFCQLSTSVVAYLGRSY